MLQKLDESIEVTVNFDRQKVVPLFFRWRGKTYHVKKLNLVHKEPEGGDKIYYFSVSDDVNYFRLAFFTRDLSWRIRELFFEG